MVSAVFALDAPSGMVAPAVAAAANRARTGRAVTAWWRRL